MLVFNYRHILATHFIHYLGFEFFIFVMFMKLLLDLTMLVIFEIVFEYLGFGNAKWNYIVGLISILVSLFLKL